MKRECDQCGAPLLRREATICGHCEVENRKTYETGRVAFRRVNPLPKIQPPTQERSER